MPNALGVFIGSTSALALSCAPASAQMTGHYIGGITGLDNGTAAPPGFVFTYLPLVYQVKSVRDTNGDKVVEGDLKIGAHNFLLGLTSPKTFLGAHYGA